MDALELKLSLIEQLKTIDDVKLLTQIKNLISIATEKKETRYPAQMTLEELKEVLKKSREDSTVKKARPQLSVYTTDYWILPNLYAFFRKRALSNRY